MSDIESTFFPELLAEEDRGAGTPDPLPTQRAIEASLPKKRPIPDSVSAEFCSFVKMRLNGTRPKKGRITQLATEYCVTHPERSVATLRKSWQRYGRLCLANDVPSE